MSDFCDFVPDDPSCQKPDPKPTDGGDNIDKGGDFGDKGGDLGPMDDDKMGHEDHDGEHHDMDKMEKMGKMDGQMTWDDVDEQLAEWIPGQPGGAFRDAIFMTASIAAGAYLQMFRYQSRTPDYFTYSAQVAGSGTDYYKMYNQVLGYGYLGIFSFLTVMHLLAMFGIGANGDYLVTMLIDFWGLPFFTLIGSVLAIMAYDNAYTVSQDTTSSYQATALSLMTTIQNEMTGLSVFMTGRVLSTWISNDSWAYAHYLMLDDENKEMWRDNAMVQRWIIGMGIPIWHLIDEEEKPESESLYKTAQQLIFQI